MRPPQHDATFRKRHDAEEGTKIAEDKERERGQFVSRSGKQETLKIEREKFEGSHAKHTGHY